MFAVGLILLEISLVLTLGKPRHGHPTPTPSATPSPTPTPIPKVTLAWNASSGAIGYHLWIGFASGAENQKTDVGNVLTWTVSLQSGTTYFFYVTAYDNAGDSLPSNEVSYLTPP